MPKYLIDHPATAFPLIGIWSPSVLAAIPADERTSLDELGFCVEDRQLALHEIHPCEVDRQILVFTDPTLPERWSALSGSPGCEIYDLGLQVGEDGAVVGDGRCCLGIPAADQPVTMGDDAPDYGPPDDKRVAIDVAPGAYSLRIMEMNWYADALIGEELRSLCSAADLRVDHGFTVVIRMLMVVLVLVAIAAFLPFPWFWWLVAALLPAVVAVIVVTALAGRSQALTRVREAREAIEARLPVLVVHIQPMPPGIPAVVRSSPTEHRARQEAATDPPQGTTRTMKIVATGVFVFLLPLLLFGILVGPILHQEHPRTWWVSVASVLILFGAMWYLTSIWRGKVRRDGRHIHPVLWILGGIIVMALPIAGLFTGYVAEKPWASAIQAVIYFACGWGAVQRGRSRLRQRRAEAAAQAGNKPKVDG